MVDGPRHEQIVARVRRVCAELDGAVEHAAWSGTSWRVRGTTFAHVLEIRDGSPPIYAKVFGVADRSTVVTFQADAGERRALAERDGFCLPPWRPGIVGHDFGGRTDWTELAELLLESHRICRSGRKGARS